VHVPNDTKVPAASGAFEAYYAGTHLPLAEAMPGVARLQLTRFLPGPDGSAPEYYRMAELFFTDAAQMQTTFASPEGQAAVADLANVATSGVTVLTGAVER
jgi:uncharacterized protein (TIGR02118 family)